MDSPEASSSPGGRGGKLHAGCRQGPSGEGGRRGAGWAVQDAGTKPAALLGVLRANWGQE